MVRMDHKALAGMTSALRPCQSPGARGKRSKADFSWGRVLRAEPSFFNFRLHDVFEPLRCAFPRFARQAPVNVAAGATAAIQPGGSMRDAEVIAAANRAGIAMVLTVMRHFRH